MRVFRKNRRIPWYIWPFWLLWKLIAWIVGLTGRLLAVVVGLVFMVVGGILSVTIVGAIVGIPLLIIGFLMVLKGLF